MSVTHLAQVFEAMIVGDLVGDGERVFVRASLDVDVKLIGDDVFGPIYGGGQRDRGRHGQRQSG